VDLVGVFESCLYSHLPDPTLQSAVGEGINGRGLPK
jgi:hypothetical protein